MFRSVVLLLLFHNFQIGAAQGIAFDFKTKIVGGEKVSIAQAPYQLSLELNGEHICGAAIIHKRYAMSAAHCFRGSSPRNLRLRAGSSIRETGGSLHGVGMVVTHSKYRPNVFPTEYDLAIIMVSKPFRYSWYVRRIRIATKVPAPGTLATVIGWGITNLSQPIPASHLQMVKVPIVDHEVCKKAYTNITENMICAGEPEGGKDSCQGDSGGPLVVDRKLIGITSWGYGCALPNYPGVYTNVLRVLKHFKARKIFSWYDLLGSWMVDV